MIGSQAFGQLQHREVLGRRMAYIDEGEGDAIVFQHGQPASSYAWRNVMPHLEGLGRLVACDLIGMGASDKLPSSGPGSYSYAEHREYLFALWDSLKLGDRVVLVLDDWGAMLGFDWANTHRDRVAGIVHMEAVAMPLTWAEIPEPAHPFFRALRSPDGERLVLQDNIFIETRLPGATLRRLTDEEMDAYRKPFLEAGEGRRPTLSWPRSLPIEGEPPEIVRVMNGYLPWLSQSEVPKLFINGDPGAIAVGRVREVMRTWRNQTEVTVKGRKLLQEDSPDEIGKAIADFVKRIRKGDRT